MSHPVKQSDGGTRRPTQADVAARAGVSTATVSHILSGHADRKGPGNADTRHRVERAMEELGYRPNWAGRALRRQRTGLVGAVVSAPSNPWRENLLALAQEELARHDLDLVVFPDARPGPGLDRVLDLLDRRAVDACFTVHLEDDDHPSHLADRPIPAIAFAESGFDGVAKVRHDYAGAARDAVRTLLGRGIRRVVLVLEQQTGRPEQDADYAGPILEECARVIGSEVRQVRVPYRIDADLREIPWGWLEGATPREPVVLLCPSDRIAIQIAAECTRRGLALGDRVGVVGRGDLPEGAQLPVPLSTLGTEEADYRGVFATLAAAAVSGEPIAREWSFRWRFLERAATADLVGAPEGSLRDRDTLSG